LGGSWSGVGSGLSFGLVVANDFGMRV
jgi:hypothetical protein